MITREVTDDWKQANIMSIFKKDPLNCRAVSPTSVPGKIMQQILEGMSEQRKD